MALFIRKMIYSFRIVFTMWFVVGMISFGCNSVHHKNTGSAGDLNQVDKLGARQGPWEIFADSVLIGKGVYVDGKQDGLWTTWHKNGQMKEEGHFDRGIKTGTWIEWYPDGEIMWKGEWEEGTRSLKSTGASAEITFIGQDHPDRQLAVETVYHVRIRLQNIPAGNLFIEVSNGEITREGDPDLFTLRTSSDTMFTMAIGFIPDLEFMDFRNLVSEIDFTLR